MSACNTNYKEQAYASLDIDPSIFIVIYHTGMSFFAISSNLGKNQMKQINIAVYGTGKSEICDMLRDQCK